MLGQGSRRDILIKLIDGDFRFLNLFVDPKLSKALIQFFGKILARMALFEAA